MSDQREVKSLYLHFPYCRHLCNYCDFFKSVPTDWEGSLEDFNQKLKASLIPHAALLEKNHFRLGKLETFYVGGGTPSLWGNKGLDFFASVMPQHWQLAADYEWTMEVNPGSFQAQTLAEYRRLGVNRFSVGIQALNPQMLKILDRVHDLAQALATLELMATWEMNYSVDFMIGLPQMVRRNIIAELEQVLAFRPSHLSVYILTVKGNYIHREKLPPDDSCADEFLAVSEFLKQAGYRHYEVSNFALPGKSSRHNMKYWQGQSVAALGPSASGLLRTQKTRALRYKWRADFKHWDEELLGPGELRLEDLFLGLRTEGKKDLVAMLGGKELSGELNQLMQKWLELGHIIQADPRAVELTAQGLLMLDTLIGDLFVFLDE